MLFKYNLLYKFVFILSMAVVAGGFVLPSLSDLPVFSCSVSVLQGLINKIYKGYFILVAKV